MGRYRHDRAIGRSAIARADCPGSLLPVHHGHRDIHQDHIEFLRLRPFDSGFAVNGFGHGMALGLDHGAGNKSVYFVVLDQKNGQRPGDPVGIRGLFGRFGRIRRRLLLDGKRDAQPEHAALARFAFDADLPPHQADETLGDAKSQTGSPGPPRIRRIQRFEILEYACQIFRGDADPRIDHPKFDQILLPRQTLHLDIDRSRTGKFDRIAHQIQKHLPQTSGIAENLRIRLSLPRPSD